MAPPLRSRPNPAPRTQSAKDAQSVLFCELCSKQYSRMTDFHAHQLSYDHLHNQRSLNMRKLQRDTVASEFRAKRRADEEVSEITPIKFGSQTGNQDSGTLATKSTGTGVKKGGFRKAFAGDVATIPTPPLQNQQAPVQEGDQAGEDTSMGHDISAVPSIFAQKEEPVLDVASATHAVPLVDGVGGAEDECDSDDVGYEYYDPTKPTDCSCRLGEPELEGQILV